MKKLTYTEQLKHPNWQRKRLEVLEYYRFECASCGDKEKTLHVHHKHYVKGRMAWEYETEELEALCEDCHENHHFIEDRLTKLIHDEGTANSEILGLVGGYLIDSCSEPGLVEEARQAGDLNAFSAGALAAWAMSASLDDSAEVYALVVKLNGDKPKNAAGARVIESYLSFLRS